MRLLRGAAAAIRRLNDAGVLVVVVTNQRGISLGRMTEDGLRDVHARVGALLAAQAGAHVDAFLHCPHNDGDCDCRKPQPGLLREAVRRFPEIDLDASVLIGDAPSDAAAGEGFGVSSLQLGRDAADLEDAVDIAMRRGMIATIGEMTPARG